MADQKYNLELHVSIRPQDNFSQGLEIRETVTLRVDTFMEVAKVLSSFHDLAQTLKAAK